MQLRYDEELIEAAVSQCASGRCHSVPPLQIARFHREREEVYLILDPDKRGPAFTTVYLGWFCEWGLGKPVADVLTEFPLLTGRLSLLIVRKASGKDDEGAELYVTEGGRQNAILALRAESFKHDVALRDYVRHEFTHLGDMLNPAFGYAPTLDLPGLNGSQMRLARERYRLLWDITIDGRLSAGGHTPAAARAQHAAAFARSYPFWSESRQSEIFDALWHNIAPRHADFLALIADPRGLHGRHRPAPGALCPLCDFPTFHWAEASSLPSGIIGQISAEFPAWSPEQGLCNRCQETYEAAANLRLPTSS